MKERAQSLNKGLIKLKIADKVTGSSLLGFLLYSLSFCLFQFFFYINSIHTTILGSQLKKIKIKNNEIFVNQTCSIKKEFFFLLIKSVLFLSGEIYFLNISLGDKLYPLVCQITIRLTKINLQIVNTPKAIDTMIKRGDNR